MSAAPLRIAAATAPGCSVLRAGADFQVGAAPWSEAVDLNIGAAGVYTPSDYGFPDVGLRAVGELNRPLWVYADLDFAKAEDVRRSGQVFNFRDWPHQLRF